MRSDTGEIQRFMTNTDMFLTLLLLARRYDDLIFQAVQVFGKQGSEHNKSLTVKFSRAPSELFTEADIQSNSVDWNNEGFCFLL